jgi:hypothetical protein
MNVTDYIAAGLLFAALAGFMLIRRILMKDERYNTRFMLLVMGAAVMVAVAGTLLGNLRNPN